MSFKPLASALWSCASATTRALADHGVLKREKFEGVRVISVGNIQAGGAGKTPLTAEIAREACARGLSVAILTRGYGGAWEVSGGMILPGEAQPKTDLCGDEAALLHELAPEAVIGIGADRAAQFRKISAVRKVDLVLLDDGFQHWKIARDLDIVAVTSASRDEFFFRDWEGALANADLIVWTKGEEKPITFGKPLVKTRFLLPKAAEPGRIHLVTGVADSAEVRKSAEAAGYSVVEHSAFPDHAQYEPGWVVERVRRAREAGLRIAVTGKDWVKWRESGVPREDVIVLEPRIEFVSGHEEWEKILWK